MKGMKRMEEKLNGIRENLVRFYLLHNLYIL